MLKKIQSQLTNKKHRHYMIALSLLVTIVLLLIILRLHAALALNQRTKEAAVTVVATMIVKPASGTEKIVLPGNVSAWHEAPIYARTNGYIQNWYVDIGSRIKAGDLLALIEAPELNAQKRQAEADLNTAIANNKLAQITANRWIDLRKTDFVSKQATDEKVSAAEAMYAAMIAAQANVQRLKELVAFERVIAPFDGVITARATDIGALINAGSSTTAKPLFRIAQTDPLRIYVKVPQNYAGRIIPNMKVSLHFAEHPHKEFPAKLLDTANAIDPTTRTLLTQFTAENKKGELLPGGYTEVWFVLDLPPNTIRLPINTLLFQAGGLQVATVDKENKIVLKSVTLNRDFGTEVEIATGVTPGDKVVINPPDSISNGEKVRITSSI